MNNFWNRVAQPGYGTQPGYGGTQPGYSQPAQAPYDALMATRRELEQRVQEQEAQLQQADQFADFMNVVGRKMVEIINNNAIQGGADTGVVAGEFQRAFPQAGPVDFRQTVDTLVREGLIYEMKGAEGFMGQRTTRLYVMPS
ncbi:hypothetical protein [Microbispora siamensis]|uniref:Uncharacterized protein n=1 Tax=Microbispora siamensis TaxID=564413 RepID=A0ABQ4GRH9_9ACTN|nr:hypothetical protein [Microbispora siamensis]GIH63978.1 hypothetical protein Msi02_47950 [Microbispora siamensis]